MQLYTHTHTHTDVLDNNKNKKIYERDIYENASNCGAKIKTFEEIELNVVGADASVRPQMEKEKDNRTGRPKEAQPLQLLTKTKYKNKIIMFKY